MGISPIQSPFIHTSILLPLTTYPSLHCSIMLDPCVRLPVNAPEDIVGSEVQSEMGRI